MTWLLLWMACESSEPETWRAGAGLEPVLERMDHDQSGAVSPTEFAVHAWKAPDFASIDQNGNQELSSEELRSLLYSQDVQRFDGREDRKPVDKEEWARPFAQPRDVRQLWELLSFLDQELLAASPESSRPSFSERDTASRTGTLDSPEVLSVLGQFRQGFQAAGLSWPEGLLKTKGTQ
jgi:hypothetical protein